MTAAPQHPKTLAWLQQRQLQRAQRNKLGMVGYAHLGAMLRSTPCTAVQLKGLAQLGQAAAYRWLMSLHGLGRVHIAGWQSRPRVPTVPVFAWGPGIDCPPPRLRPNGKPVQAINLPAPRVCASLVAWEYLLRSIESPASRQEVKAATGLDNTTLQESLAALLAVGLAHIPLWLDRPQGGNPLPQYQLGAGTNAPMPRPKRAEQKALVRTRQARQRTFGPLAQAFNAMAAQDRPA